MNYTAGSHFCDLEHDVTFITDILERVRKYDDQTPFRPDMREVRNAVPNRLHEVIKRSWAENPSERPSASYVLKEVQKINPSKYVHVRSNFAL